ncbi:M23 family metallopeptidase [Thalassotalea piscium]|uniref:Murein DD-endopeptidase MepM/ murein hydrolase activator NlpD n=2 Tax=Thalassotalea piscium TaxID=1230533 RepID=A0A7X0NE51_9GAMM|nr:M23 family metallopeptidase [Thalassotalea piscium]MBB6541762.1 murein DD-endopeptidase MepM/ murein hydrolase activator NlpD [Thalassotalea piscium]
MKLNKLHWMSAALVFALISGFIIHLLLTSEAQPQTPLYTFTDSKDSYDIELKEKSQQVTALTIKLAELQSQVLRLNALGDRLAEQANIPENEFNFSELPPSGGPMIQSHVNQTLSASALFSDVQALETELQLKEKQLKLLESLTFGHHIENTSYLSGRPIKKGWLSSYYGVRKDPFNGRPAMHKGVDFAGKENTHVIATAAGVVSWASERYGYGQLIEIDHGKGIKTRYGHNKELLVNVGDVVNKGQSIALMGSTGRSTGPHVHYEILRNNKHIDPVKYVYRKAK